MAGRSRWFVGSSRTRKFTPSAAKAASSARVRSPGESDDEGRTTASAPSPNFANCERAWSRARPVAVANASARVERSPRMRRSWASSPITTLGPMRRLPAASGSRPSTASTREVFPDPLGPTSATRSPHAMSTVNGPSVNAPRSTTASSSRTTTSPDRAASLMVKRRSQPSHGFSTTGSASRARSVLRGATGQGLGSLDPEVALRLVVVAWPLLLARHPRRRPLALASGPLSQLVALRFVHGVVHRRVCPISGALVLVGGPPTAIGASMAGVFVELEDVGHGSFEEGAVVRHDHHASATPRHDILQSGQPVEVQIVGRFVEQRDVEAGEENGCQGDFGFLSARKRGHGVAPHVDREPDLRVRASRGGPRSRRPMSTRSGPTRRRTGRPASGLPVARAEAAAASSCSAADTPARRASAAATVSSPSRMCSWCR